MHWMTPSAKVQSLVPPPHSDAAHVHDVVSDISAHGSG
jgi:hypothetical protein